MQTAIIPTSSIVDFDGEARIQDIVLGERLGFDRPRKVRDLIDRNHLELMTYGSLPRHGANPGNRGGRPSQAYYLNEGQALVICALSRTQRAVEVRKLLIDVFMAWRQGKVVDVKPHYRRPPQSSETTFHSAEMISYDGKTALIELWMPFPKAIALMKSLNALS